MSVRGRSALLVPLLLLTASCGIPGLDDNGADGDEAETALLAQRDDVAATAETLVAATRDAVGGEVVETQGGWEGCTSIFPEGYADFQYAARVQLRAPGSPERLVDRLQEAADASGLEVVGTRTEGVEVRDGEVTALLRDLPAVNKRGDVTIQLVADPCVDVPRDDWEAWMGRDDPGPDVG